MVAGSHLGVLQRHRRCTRSEVRYRKRNGRITTAAVGGGVFAKHHPDRCTPIGPCVVPPPGWNWFGDGCKSRWVHSSYRKSGLRSRPNEWLVGETLAINLADQAAHPRIIRQLARVVTEVKLCQIPV